MELSEADFLILDTLDETRTGGREVEFGHALAWGIPVIRVGPARNLFHHRARRVYNAWPSPWEVIHG